MNALTRRELLRNAGFGAAAIAVPSSLSLIQNPLGRPVRRNPGFQIPVGMNLAGIADWEFGFPFANLMLGSRKWLTCLSTGGGPWNTNVIDQIPLDADGYPLEVPYAVAGVEQHVFTLLPSCLEAGRYVVLWEGDGELNVELSCAVVSRSANRMVIQMNMSDDGGAMVLKIRRSARGNHVRNIRVLRESEENRDLAANPWRQDFLDWIAPFGTLRFMDWQRTNNSTESTWAGRKRPTFYTMVGDDGNMDPLLGTVNSPFDQLYSGGVAHELIIDLCNRTGKDCWICVPHFADDEYIRQMAMMYRQRLNRNLKIYLEFSNEIWNWQFNQAQWMLRAERSGDALVKQGIPAWKNRQTREGDRHPERIGWLFRHTFGIWERVFSGADRQRIVRVVSSQFGWYDVVQRTVKYVMENGGADALSVTGYFGPDDTAYSRWEAAGANCTAAMVLEDMNRIIDGPVKNGIAQYKALAAQYGLTYNCYEAGQHIQPKNQAETNYMPALAAAQSDPGMYDCYIKNLRYHSEAGVSLFVVFSSVGKQGERWGSWGHAPKYSTPLSQAPKLRALIEANAA